MNIFILDNNIKKCARYHCDKHVVKMILEYTQILCTVCNENEIKTPYRSTHKKHPCVLWAGASVQNWLWLKSLTTALNAEYKYRYKKDQDHASYKIASSLPTPALPNLGITAHPQTMPEEFRIPQCPVLAYRQYYIARKRYFANWTRRHKPVWFK